MKETLRSGLVTFGFTITQESEKLLVGSFQSFGHGVIEIVIQLPQRTFDVKLREQFSEVNLFYGQRFDDYEHLHGLLEGNYPIFEWMIDRSDSPNELERKAI